MSKATRKLFEQVKDGRPLDGAIEFIKEGLQEGMSLSKVFDDIVEKSGQMWTQGRAELAQALFTDGTAYVPYGPGQNPGDKDHDSPLHGPAADAASQKEVDGREM
jgi:hypothetical protein